MFELIIGKIADVIASRIEQRLEAAFAKQVQLNEISTESEGLMLELSMSQTKEEYYAVLRKINNFANQHSKRK